MELEYCLFNGERIQTKVESRYDQTRLQRRSVNARQQGEIGLCCPLCHYPLFIRRVHGRYYGFHYGQKRSEIILEETGYKLPAGVVPTAQCAFRSESTNKSPGEIYSTEGELHKRAVEHLALALDCDPVASQVHAEKRITGYNGLWRKPDVQCMVDDHLTVFEFQSSWLPADVIAEREAFYQENDIRLIWLFADEDIEWTVEDEYGNEHSGTYNYQSNLSTVSNISIGSYIETYKLGATALTYVLTRDPLKGFGALVKAQPFVRYQDRLILLTDSHGDPEFITPQKKYVGLRDLHYVSGCPLPVWWKFDSVRSITQYISDHAKDFDFEPVDELTKKDVDKLTWIYNQPGYKPPGWYDIFHRLLVKCLFPWSAPGRNHQTDLELQRQKQ